MQFSKDALEGYAGWVEVLVKVDLAVGLLAGGILGGFLGGVANGGLGAVLAVVGAAIGWGLAWIGALLLRIFVQAALAAGSAAAGVHELSAQVDGLEQRLANAATGTTAPATKTAPKRRPDGWSTNPAGLREGARITHKLFGDGEIVSINGERMNVMFGEELRELGVEHAPLVVRG
jgi:hypothetical protein